MEDQGDTPIPPAEGDSLRLGRTDRSAFPLLVVDTPASAEIRQ
jgi:hypothetical protein